MRMETIKHVTRECLGTVLPNVLVRRNSGDTYRLWLNEVEITDVLDFRLHEDGTLRATLTVMIGEYKEISIKNPTTSPPMVSK